MPAYKQCSVATYNRNVKSGKWQELREPNYYTGFIRTTKSTRGCHNYAGRAYIIEFTVDKKELS